MSFKTDYKDAAWTGDRKYTISGTGTNQTITDTTSYTTEGDQVGAAEFNAIGRALNRHDNIVTVTLETANWSSTAPYAQTVSVPGMLATDNPIVSLAAYTSDSAATVKNMKKTIGLIDRAVTANGSITFYCMTKKPTSLCRLYLTGVSEE